MFSQNYSYLPASVTLAIIRFQLPPPLSLFTFLALLSLSIYCHSLQISSRLWTCVLGFPLCMCVRSVILLFTSRKPAIIYRFQTKRKWSFFSFPRYIFLNNSFLQEHFRSFLREVFFFSPHIVFKVCVCVCASAHVKSRTSWKYCFSCKHAHRFLFSFLKKRKGKIVWSQSYCISIYCDHKTIFSLFTLTLVTRFQVSFLFSSIFCWYRPDLYIYF